MEGNQPRVRPFGVAEIVDGKLYLTTGRKKNVYKQIEANDGNFVTPYIADGEARFCSFNGEERRVKF